MVHDVYTAHIGISSSRGKENLSVLVSSICLFPSERTRNIGVWFLVLGLWKNLNTADL